VVSAAYEIIQGKGATNYAIGLAVAQILEAILGDENRVLSVSSLLRDYQGIDDVCLSVPSLVNRRGVEVPLDVPLSDSELAGLRASGDAVRQVCRDLGL
jgi:L-lactate dehydrogenase